MRELDQLKALRWEDKDIAATLAVAIRAPLTPSAVSRWRGRNRVSRGARAALAVLVQQAKLGRRPEGGSPDEPALTEALFNVRELYQVGDAATWTRFETMLTRLMEYVRSRRA